MDRFSCGSISIWATCVVHFARLSHTHFHPHPASCGLVDLQTSFVNKQPTDWRSRYGLVTIHELRHSAMQPARLVGQAPNALLARYHSTSFQHTLACETLLRIVDALCCISTMAWWSLRPVTAASGNQLSCPMSSALDVAIAWSMLTLV